MEGIYTPPSEFQRLGRDWSEEEREEAKKSGDTFDGTDKFPIKTCEDVHAARVRLHQTNEDKSAVEAYINRKSKQLGCGDSKEGSVEIEAKSCPQCAKCHKGQKCVCGPDCTCRCATQKKGSVKEADNPAQPAGWAAPGDDFQGSPEAEAIEQQKRTDTEGWEDQNDVGGHYQGESPNDQVGPYGDVSPVVSAVIYMDKGAFVGSRVGLAYQSAKTGAVHSGGGTVTAANGPEFAVVWDDGEHSIERLADYQIESTLPERLKDWSNTFSWEGPGQMVKELGQAVFNRGDYRQEKTEEGGRAPSKRHTENKEKGFLVTPYRGPEKKKQDAEIAENERAIQEIGERYKRQDEEAAQRAANAQEPQD